MTRVVYGGNVLELGKANILGCIMVDLDFASGHLYLNDGFHECVYNSNTYKPVGTFGGIDVVDEGLDTLARPLKMTLSGVDPTLIGTAENEIYQNRPAVVYSALINQTTGALVDNPEIAWEGRMDYMEIALDKNVGKITLNCEHRLRREPRIARYTNADQQTAWAGDLFFDQLANIPGFKASWGNSTVNWGGPTGGGTGRTRDHTGGGRR